MGVLLIFAISLCITPTTMSAESNSSIFCHVLIRVYVACTYPESNSSIFCHVRTWSFDTYVPRTYDCTCSSYSSSFFNPVEFSTRQSTTYTCVVVYVEPPTIRADTWAFSCKNCEVSARSAEVSAADSWERGGKSTDSLRERPRGEPM
jgi:hypothetical protein